MSDRELTRSVRRAAPRGCHRSDPAVPPTSTAVDWESGAPPPPHAAVPPPPGRGPNGDRVIVVTTMSYEHIFRRPNLARTAAQLAQAGPVLWVVIEDTHSLRKMASTTAHYDWIVADTRAYIGTLGVDAVYIAEPSPFPPASPRSPKIETHQRNLGLSYVPA